MMFFDMVTVSLRSLVVGLVAALLIGCGSTGGDTVDKDYLKNAEAIGKQRREIFLRAGTEYDKMSAEDKKSYLDSFDGNEDNAKKFWDLMKYPPTQFRPGMPSNVGGSGTQTK